MSCCIELVQTGFHTPLVVETPRAPVIRVTAVQAVITGAGRAALVLPRLTIPIIGGQTRTGGTGGGGNLNEVFKVVFLNTGDVALRGDGTIVTARV